MTSDQFFDRELSWLQFNARVLHEAMDSRNPLLERVRFLQIFTMNLDEFFMKRVGGIKNQEVFRKAASSGSNEKGGIAVKDHSASREIMGEIRKTLLPILNLRAECWTQEISPALEKEGILLLGWSDLDLSEQERLEAYFDQNLFGALTPLTVDPGHPFPFISNLSTSLGVSLRNTGARQPKKIPTNIPKRFNEQPKDLIARVKIPTNYPAWIRLDPEASLENGVKFISLSDVINQFLDRLFPGMEISGSFSFRLTRNADVELGQDEEGEMEDLLETVTEQLRARRFASVVRLEHSSTLNSSFIGLLKGELALYDEDVYEQSLGLDFSVLKPIWDLGLNKLKYKKWRPVIPEPLKDEKKSIFSIIQEQDLLVHHPYESFPHTVERFVASAVHDPQVLAIKMVLYRTGVDSPFIPHLIRAAELGKQVVCLVELKARFDEESNIQVARMLERAGVHVLYGIVGLKTHCKVTLVVRQEDGIVRSYVHLGTGNYNANTAQIYTDLGLFTADPVITRDTIKLFHYLTGGGSATTEFEKLVVGPIHLKNRFLELIRFEKAQAKVGQPAKIIAKMNSLEDQEMIRELYSASQAGVKIELIVRGFCSLKPKVPGLSENITVTSVVGRFLEHSRIFYFQNGKPEPIDGVLLIGSADWMPRNLNWRVEALAPIESPVLKLKILELLRILHTDQRQVWDLNSEGQYLQRKPRSGGDQEGVHDRVLKMFQTLDAGLNF